MILPESPAPVAAGIPRQPDPIPGTRLLAAVVLTFALSAARLPAATYHVSQSAGNDTADGKSEATAWKTLAKASAGKYVPGDKILLKRGDTWNEELQPQGEGTAANPITIGSYGDGPRPRIDRQEATGNNIDKVCIRLKNTAGYQISGIEFARFGRGVFVDLDKGVHGKDFVRIEDCYFHDALYYHCTGWYTEAVPSDGGTGPDYVFDVGVWVQTRETADVICLSNITVADCRFERIACAINVWSGNEWDKNAENRHEFRNVVIERCSAEDGKNWQFVVHSTHGGRLAHSWVHRVGYFHERATNGIAGAMLYRCEDFAVENCEFGHVSIGDGSGDGQTFDLEGNNTRTVFRDCLFHETEGAGFLMCWGASANANTKNKDTRFENCVFHAKETWPARQESRGNQVFCGDGGNTATFRQCTFYLADGEKMAAPAEFQFADCTEVAKAKGFKPGRRLTGKVAASSMSGRHPVGNASDGNPKTTWQSDSGTAAGEWLELDFGTPERVERVILRENAFSSVSRFVIQAWDERTASWRDCLNGSGIGPNFLATPVPVTTQKIRLLIHRTAYGSPAINEFEAYAR